MLGNVQHVVVGFDGSPYATRALRWGIDEARRWNAGLRVLVAVGDVPSGGDRVAKAYQDWAQEWAALAERIVADPRSGLLGCDVAVVPGDARTALASASAADTVVVVGSLGHGVVGGAVLGSVSQHLARHAAGPLVVVRGESGDGPGRVLVGADGSPGSERALDFAMAHAAAARLPVEALLARPTHLTRGTPLAIDVTRMSSREMTDAERWLSEAVTGRADDYPDVAVEQATAPLDPAQALIDASATAGLLVVGSRGRGAVVGAVLGSVSQAVLRQAHCPVAVIR